MVHFYNYHKYIDCQSSYKFIILDLDNINIHINIDCIQVNPYKNHHLYR